MLVLLFLSSLAATLVPVREPGDTSTSTTSTGTKEPRLPAGGRLVTARVIAGGERETVALRAGDQLQLRVTGKRPETVELIGLGGTDEVTPTAPALFDVLVRDRGRYPLRSLDSGKVLAMIEVRALRARARPEPASTPARGRRARHAG